MIRPYENTSKRIAHRNGTRRPRSFKTVYGESSLINPKSGSSHSKPKIFERYSGIEESVIVAVAESYLGGVSIREVEKVFSKFGLENISASEATRITKKLSETAAHPAASYRASRCRIKIGPC